MDDNVLHKTAFDHALSLPGAEEYEFVPGWIAVRVSGKWFMVASEKDGRQLVNVKAEPSQVLELTEAFDSITPGYHMNKRHWVTITAGPDIEPGFVEELITDSYSLIIERLPVHDRPVGSQAFISG